MYKIGHKLKTNKKTTDQKKKDMKLSNGTLKQYKNPRRLDWLDTSTRDIWDIDEVTFMIYRLIPYMSSVWAVYRTLPYLHSRLTI